LDWLAEELSTIFEDRAGRLLKDPWKARDDYITVSIQESEIRRELFLKKHAIQPLETEDKIEVFQIMESQRMALYMFTSCAWFFDDISGLEVTQVLKYAARAIEMTRPWALKDLEAGLISFLASARSNDPVYGDGKRVYQTLVKPSRIGASLAAAHYAFSTLLKGLLWDTWLFQGIVQPVQEHRLSGKGLNAVLGEIRIRETGTGREFKRTFLALRYEDGASECYIGESLNASDMERAFREITSILHEESSERIEDVPGTYLMGSKRYGIKDLIPDMHGWLIRGMAGDLNHRIKDFMGQYNGDLKRLIFFLKETGEPAPEMLGGILGLVMADRLTRLMTSEETDGAIDWPYLHDLAAQTMSRTIDMNRQYLRQVAHSLLKVQMKRLSLSPDGVCIRDVSNLLDLTEKLRILPDLWECQNIFYDLHNDQDFTQNLDNDLSSAFDELGRKLGFIIKGE
ncbi:MAG: DUF3536 domain-containing protein, partial [Thermodesulfobacteriota bacterium]|nr:DUF3536 domain-containing protein [Thermodesulfobacteriota bacterium]